MPGLFVMMQRIRERVKSMLGFGSSDDEEYYDDEEEEDDDDDDE